MPLWDSNKGDIGYGGLPNNTSIQFGGSGPAGAFMRGAGDIFTFVSPAGLNPGIINQDNVVAAYTLPAGAFDQVGRGLQIIALGGFASNTNSKRAKIIINPATAVVGSQVGAGGTTIADTGAFTTAAAVGWSLEANIFKAAAANSQAGIHISAQIGATVGTLLAPSALTLTEANAILIAVTLNCVTALTDGTLNLAEIFAMN